MVPGMVYRISPPIANAPTSFARIIEVSKVSLDADTEGQGCLFRRLAHLNHASLPDKVTVVVVKETERKIGAAPSDKTRVRTKGELRGFAAQRGFKITGIGNGCGGKNKKAKVAEAKRFHG